MKLQLLKNTGTTLKFPNLTDKFFYPIEITKSFLFIKYNSIAYPTLESYKIFDGSWYIKFVDKFGEEYSVSECKSFTEFTLLEQIHNKLKS